MQKPIRSVMYESIIYYALKRTCPFRFEISSAPPEDAVQGYRRQIRKGVVVGTLKELYLRYVNYDLQPAWALIIYDKMKLMPGFYECEEKILRPYIDNVVKWKTTDGYQSDTVINAINQYRAMKSKASARELRKTLKENKIPVLI